MRDEAIENARIRDSGDSGPAAGFGNSLGVCCAGMRYEGRDVQGDRLLVWTSGALGTNRMARDVGNGNGDGVLSRASLEGWS